jgi:uncharacterized protein YjiS (DUF1127 family)
MFTRFAMTQAGYGTAHVPAGLRELARRVARIPAVHASRRELAELEPRLLNDIGVTPRQAMSESRRAPWDTRPARPERRGGAGGPGMAPGLAATFGTALRMALRRWQSRRRISELDMHALRDIGVTFADAEREANKAFWQR